MRRHAGLVAFVAAFTLSAPARAQVAPDAGAPTGLAAPAEPLTVPAPPTIDDPQLAPPPAAARVLHSWEEALAMVRAESPDFRTTYDNVLKAEAQRTIALAGVLPSLSAQASYARQLLITRVPGLADGYPPQDQVQLGASLVWPVLDLRAHHARGTAEESQRAAELDLADKRRTIGQAVVTAMLESVENEHAAELNRVGLRAALERLSLARTKTKFGSGTELDIDRAQQDLAAARALVITGDESLRQTRETLGLALGSSNPIGVPTSVDLDGLEKAIAGTCRLNDAIERRADVAAAKSRVTVADRTIDDAWYAFAPSLSIESQLAWTNKALLGVDYSALTTWQVEGVLNVPIWDGGARQGQLRQARVMADQARQTLISTRISALVAVAQAQRAVSVTAASRDVAQEQRDLALRVDKRTREGYLHGLGTSLDLVTSAQALRAAELNLLGLQYQAAQARMLAILANAECVY